MARVSACRYSAPLKRQPPPFDMALYSMLHSLLRPLLLIVLFAAVTVQAADPAGRWTINMRDADIRDFVEQVASISGQTLVVDPRVKGQVTVVSQAPLTLTEVYQLFLSVMATHGYAVLTEGDQARIVPDGEARSNPSNGKGGEAVETRLIQVQQTPVAELLPLIRPLVPTSGHLAAIPSANALIVSDRSANIDRLVKLIAEADKARTNDNSFYSLQHAWAGDVAQALMATQQAAGGQGGAAVQVIADNRTNRLLLLGPAEARQRMVRLAQGMDVPATRSGSTRVIRLRHGDAESVAKTLSELSDKLRPAEGQTTSQPPLLVRADKALNAVVLLASPDLLGQLEDLVRQLDVPRAQVLVEAAIVELSGDISEALGVQWAVDGRSGNNGIGGTNFSNTGLSVGTLLGALQSKTAVPLPDGAVIGLGNGDFGALVTALSANTKSNLLSTPSLLTLDNQKAEILVGQNVPFQTGSYTTDAAGASNPFTTIERKDVGVTLKVTPHINEGGTLRMEIEQEISSIAPSAGLAAKTVDLVTNKRSIKSTVLADNGQVIVLGGLIQDDVSETVSKVPLLGDIPLLGRLFQSTKDTKIKRNLMVFLRPSVVRDAAGLASLSADKYRDIQVFSQGGKSSSALPVNPQQLFQSAPAVDLRMPEVPQTLIERPRPVNPAQLGNGQGGETRSLARPLQVAVATPLPATAPLAVSQPAMQASAQPPTATPAGPAQRYRIALIEGDSEAYIKGLLELNPKEPLKLEQQQRNGQPWYQLYYGDYADAELAHRALSNMTSNLPRQRGKVVAY